MQNILSIVARVWRRGWDDHIQTNASALSFTTVLALVPSAAVAFSTLSVFPVFADWSTSLESFVYQNLVPAAGEIVQSHLQQFVEQTGKLTAFGLLLLFFSALLLLFTIEETLNKIWRVEEGRPLVQRLFSYWAVLTLGPLLIGASLSLSSYLISVTLSGNAGAEYLRTALLTFLPLVFETLAFILLYTAVPNRPVMVKHAFIGGLAAALLFEATKRIFAWAVLNFANYEVIYGALAAIPIFLIWVYLSWLVVLIGAEVTAVIGEDSGGQELS